MMMIQLGRNGGLLPQRQPLDVRVVGLGAASILFWLLAAHQVYLLSYTLSTGESFAAKKVSGWLVYSLGWESRAISNTKTAYLLLLQKLQWAYLGTALL